MADYVLQAGEYMLAPLYGEECSFAPDHPARQFLSLYIFTTIGAFLMYFSCAGFNYYFLYDRVQLQQEYDKLAAGKPTTLLPQQVKYEILYTCWATPQGTALQAAVFLLEVRGYSNLYDNVSDYGVAYLLFSLAFFLFFTDMLIYFIHRALHWPSLYWIHKPHHKWIWITPFASHAFHPLDGFAQGLPYHIFVFLFPFHKITYLCMFVGVNLWTISIHDMNYQVPQFMRPYINGAAHHTEHHTKFFFNYGQYFTLWDRLCNSMRDPVESFAEVDRKYAQKSLQSSPKGQQSNSNGKLKGA